MNKKNIKTLSKRDLSHVYGGDLVTVLKGLAAALSMVDNLKETVKTEMDFNDALVGWAVRNTKTVANNTIVLGGQAADFFTP